MLEINNIKVNLDYTDNDVFNKVCKQLHIIKEDIIDLKIMKRSIDARDGIVFILKVFVKLKNEDFYQKRFKLNKAVIEELEIPKSKKLNVVVVGMGPAGLFAGYVLAKAGAQPIIIERGCDVDTRSEDIALFMEKGNFNPKSNILFGEGGAGTFSDGKLGTGIKDKNIRYVYNTFVKFGANEDILIDSMPHIGTDYLRIVVKNMRNEIIRLGGKVLFKHKLEGFITKDNKLQSIKVRNLNDDSLTNILTDYVILAIGHSARDTYSMLKESNINLQPKPFSMGVRIEHKREMIDKSQYKEFYNHKMLKAASYKLSYIMDNKRGVYTFCMCPGGVVVPATSEENMVVTNGMSYYKRDSENSNSALLVSVFPSDFESSDPLSGVEFQRKYEKKAYEISKSYKAPVQLVKDFMVDRKSTKIGSIIPSYKPGYVLANLKDCLPGFVVDGIKKGLVEFDKKIKGFKMDDSVLTGVETRSSSPVRILRNENLVSNIDGLYPCGEGAGYAGGITSSAIDGIKVALKIIMEENK